MQLNVMTKHEAMLQFGLALLSLFKTLIIVTICYVLSSTKNLQVNSVIMFSAIYKKGIIFITTRTIITNNMKFYY